VSALEASETEAVLRILNRFSQWLESYGESSWDYQSYYAGPIGGRAKSLYYRRPLLGKAAVAPMVFSEAAVPSLRRLFSPRMRFPIADAHYAIGFCLLHDITSNPEYLERALHFLDVLKRTRCREFKEYCWGYPFDWVWRGGVIKRQTPLITTTPYVYEAFLQVYELVDRETFERPTPNFQRPTSNAQKELKQILASIARHAAIDIKDFPVSRSASSCSYSPRAEGNVINASAYRAFLLTSASQLFDNRQYWHTAERNLNFVLEQQNADGSWFYAADGVRDFIDHYHTCFVMKALAKIERLTGDAGCGEALERGVSYYLANLFDETGLPKPFAKAPRLTVYQRELYDYAECINLCLLLRDRFPQLEVTLRVVTEEVLNHWVKRDGSFRSRKLHLGWDNVPMHRWGQAQMFRALAFFVCEMLKAEKLKLKAEMVRVEMVKS
jgi:hypothetical protein